MVQGKPAGQNATKYWEGPKRRTKERVPFSEGPTSKKTADGPFGGHRPGPGSPFGAQKRTPRSRGSRGSQASPAHRLARLTLFRFRFSSFRVEAWPGKRKRKTWYPQEGTSRGVSSKSPEGLREIQEEEKNGKPSLAWNTPRPGYRGFPQWANNLGRRATWVLT